MVDKEKFTRLDDKLKSQNRTKTEWLNAKIDEELEENTMTAKTDTLTEKSKYDTIRDNLRKHYPDLTDGHIDALTREYIMYDNTT